ncbi:MAG: ABC transporter substrate-binding protein [Candidatus Atribacteria bacterium]|jgi:peptide/nickel transport system substrate-binding protein|nr:ABC transporter substrate-binding protein [Candidatus Atribacteria bacterium]
MKKIKFLIIVLFLVLGLIMTAFIGGIAAGKDSIKLAVAFPPSTMNPHGANVDCNLSVMGNIFEGLLYRNAEGKILPGLATSWERIDELTWRFTLRKGVKFHNGNDFTWEDVKYTFNRLKEPYPVSEFLAIGGMIESVETVGNDSWTIDVKTTIPVPYFDQPLHLIFIMDKESTETRSIGEIGQNPIGTGPYKFVEWIRGAYLELTTNENYWGEVPSIKNAKIISITEPSTRLAAIITGEVDIMQDIPVEFFETATDDSNLEVITRPARRCIYLGLRNSPGFPASDIRVRRAMYMAINEEEIIEKVMFGHAFPAAQIPDPPTVGYDSTIKRLPYDPERAKILLAEAGYPDGFKIKLTGPNDRYVRDAQIVEAIAKQLAKVGIEVEIDTKPKAIYWPEVDTHMLDFYLIGWFDGAYDFARSFAKLLHSVDVEKGYGGTNGADYFDPTLDKLLEESVVIVDPEVRANKIRLLSRMAMDEKIAIIPLHYQEDSYVVYKGRGIEFTPRSDTWILFREISLK